MKEKIISILLNKYVISFLLAFLIISFLPDYFKKYKLDFVSEQSTDLGRTNYFLDLDNDGFSERILVFYDNVYDQGAINIFSKDNMLVDQWNFDSKFIRNRNRIWSLDANKNNQKEIYTLTQSQDSIFLNIVEPFGDSKFQKNNIFIDKIKAYNGSFEVFSNTFSEHDISKVSKHSDIVFSLFTGFNGDVRSVYKYDLETGLVTKSPHLTNSIYVSDIIDLDNDNKNEYIINVSSYCNQIDTIYTTRSDCSSWFTILDDDLSFMFEPIEFDSPYSTLDNFVVGKTENEIICYFRPIDYNKENIQLIKFSKKGEVKQKKELDIQARLTHMFKINNLLAVYDAENSNLKYFDYNLNPLKEENIGKFTAIQPFDVDDNGVEELIKFYKQDNLLYIIDKDLSCQIPIQLNQIEGKNYFFGIKKIGRDQKPLFVVQSGFTIKFYQYTKNWFFYLKYLIYLGIYLLVILILSLVIKGYRINEEKKIKIQHQIGKLQLQTIKNKVDPHFVFNAINTISEMTLMDNKLEADKFITRFSGFMRETLNHSDKIVTSLQEEIDYTENFIKLQQIRYNYSFDFEINIDKTINKATKVPKHVLFCYVENAIKHGLALKKEGKLKIEIVKSQNNLILAIEDNGGGKSLNKNKSNSTGNGLRIMNQIYELFGKLRGKKIHHKVIELKDNSDRITGLRVEIIIENK